MTTNTKPDLIKTLQGLSDRAYCDYVTKMRSDECLGWEAKVQTQRFGKAEIEAHTKAGELLGRHKAFSEAAAKAALSTAAQPPADGDLNTIAAMFLPLGVAGYSALIGDDEIRAFARAVEATHGIKPAKEDKP